MLLFQLYRRLALGAGMLPFILLASGCASADDEGPSRVVVASLLQEAAGQIRRCYRAPRTASVAREISTRLRVRYQPDGSLAGVPVVVGQSGITPDNQSYAARMAEAAGLAVMRCAPLKLPPELYVKGWNEVDFTFSPQRRG